MKKKPYVTIFYILVVIIVGYYVFLNPHQKDYSNIENRMLIKVENIKEVKFDDYITTEFQNSVKSLLIDQFPEKDSLNKLFLTADQIRCDLLNKIGKGTKPHLIKAGTSKRISGTDYYIGDVIKANDGLTELFENRIWNFERIFDKYGDKYKMYIYKPTSVEEMSIFDNEILNSYGEQYWQEFYARLSEKYKINSLKIEGLNDYEKLYYKTDHHWNYLGAYLGYSEIINMICDDFDDIDRPYEMVNVKKHKESFYGSLSLRNAKVFGYDDFITYDLDCDKDFIYYIDGVERNGIGEKENIFAKIDAYMYEGYYGTNEKVIKIINKAAKNDKTLLVFGDSFSNCINEDLAAHFSETYIIDTRFIYDPDDISNTTFSLDDFLDNNDIDCILWLQFYESLYFDSSCYLHIDLNIQD